ncbi:MAG: hypothetical protein P0Y55_03695 [Candidatus Cohnella colombiensis]|uniref:Type II secretion system protein GspF domain-containing protein n=1 Tax=Candidatus Cohnella colombiensis TaxID=3121368 RepID=A0AA95JGN5_9BACL|nr:MAG: hypothetical protein P0Y55_03695 [Cohnella sp.]
MLKITIISLSALLFVLLFVSLKLLVTLWTDQQIRIRRLKVHREHKWSKAVAWQRLHLGKTYEHLSDLLITLRVKLHPNGFVLFSCSCGILGLGIGSVVFHTPNAAIILMLMIGGLPYLLLRMMLVNRQLVTRLEFLPAVELFYQSYLVTGSRQVRMALQRTVEERRLTGQVQTVFEQLYRNLSVKGDDEASIRRFVLTFGHVWADYFGSILGISLEEGNNVADNLKELIADMRKAQLANHVERHRLLEIRLANFTPVFFLALFLFINFRLNRDASYLYYFEDASGRTMLLNGVVMLFGSFVMGLYLSRRRM